MELATKVELLGELKTAEAAVNTHLLQRFEFEDAGKKEEWVTTGRELTRAVNVLRKKLNRKPQPSLFWY